MKILHIAPNFQRTSGVSTFVGEMVNGQVAIGDKVTVATSSQFVHEHYPVSESVCVVDMSQGLDIDDERSDVIHIHGIWTPMLHRIATHAVRMGIPIVWSTHGMVAPWAMWHKGWKKWPVWWLWQKRDLAKATVIHVTSELEAKRVQDLGFRNRLEIIPLGTNLAGLSPFGKEREKIVLFVGRLYPIKGLENLIHAWNLVQDDANCPHDWKLRLVGPDQAGYMSKLKRLCAKCNVSASVEFAGPEFEKELAEEYERASVSVLPSFTENFGGVVIDSLACGCPVIASTGTPWSVLQGDEKAGYARCGWWVDNSPECLENAIKELMNTSQEDRVLMEQRGRLLVAERYTWKTVVQELRRVYESIKH